MLRLKELRKERGMIQKDLAQLMQCSVMAISHYEVGDRQPDPDFISRLCDVFGVTADYLLGRSSTPTPAVSDEDAALLQAIHAAPPHILAAIKTLLQPYQEETSEADQAI